MTTTTLTEAAHAKINLFLHVVGRRTDGYHLLDSLVVFAGIGDRLHAEHSDSLTLDISGPFSASLSGEADNLVLRAARALAAEVGCPAAARLILDKHLPVASGIGGGSADAAAALRILCRLWEIAPDPGVLHTLAVGLGADVPVCLLGKPNRMTGVGERLDAAPALPACGLLLVNPGVALGTRDVFRARSAAFSQPANLAAAWPDAAAMAATLRELHNDLQPPAIILQPIVNEVLDAIGSDPACLLARMSGSGATCFGLYHDALAAQRAAIRLRHTNWWVWGGPLTSA